jgi:hypothetical protein
MKSRRTKFGSGSDAVDDEQVRHYVGFRFVEAKSKNAIQDAEIQLPKVSNRESPRCGSVLRAAPVSGALLPTGLCKRDLRLRVLYLPSFVRTTRP